jgi:hypothetical protein
VNDQERGGVSRPAQFSPTRPATRRAFPFLETVTADFFTHFSCVLDVGTPDNAAGALKLYQAFVEDAAHEEVPPDGFLLPIEPEHGATKLWIRDNVTGDPQQVILFVQRCAEAFGLTGRWGFQWANARSRPRVNAFGGGAMCSIWRPARRSPGPIPAAGWRAPSQLRAPSGVAAEHPVRAAA